MRVAINIDIMAKITTNLDCNPVKVRSIYKMKDKGTKFRRQKQRLYK